MLKKFHKLVNFSEHLYKLATESSEQAPIRAGGNNGGGGGWERRRAWGQVIETETLNSFPLPPVREGGSDDCRSFHFRHSNIFGGQWRILIVKPLHVVA